MIVMREKEGGKGEGRREIGGGKRRRKKGDRRRGGGEIDLNITLSRLYIKCL